MKYFSPSCFAAFVLLLGNVLLAQQNATVPNVKTIKLLPPTTNAALQRTLERFEAAAGGFSGFSDSATLNSATLNTVADRMGRENIVRVATKYLHLVDSKAEPQASIQASSQPPIMPAGLQIDRFDADPNGTARFITGRLGKLQVRLKRAASAQTREMQVFQETAAQEALSFLASSHLLPKLADPASELGLMSAYNDEVNFQHIRFEQRYNGLRVYGRDLYVHANASGDVYCVNGQYEPTPTTLVTTPCLSPVQATIVAKSAIEQYGHTVTELSSEPELLIYPFRGRNYLAYVVIAGFGGQRWRCFVDARTGLFLNRVGASPLDTPSAWGTSPNAASGHLSEPSARAVNPPHSLNTWETLAVAEQPLYAANSIATEGTSTLATQQPRKRPTAEILEAGGFINVQGVDLQGIMRTVRAWQRSSDNAIFPVSDGVGYRTTPDDQMPRRPNGGHAVLNANGSDPNSLENIVINFITPDQTFSPSIISALWLTDSALKYWATRFSRSTWDDKGTRMTTMLNVGGSDPDAAFWNSGLGAQGYGPGRRTALSTVGDLWTIGHEVGHAVNGAAARLEYNNGQQGSMEEHFANVWGWMLDRDSFWMARQAFGTDPTNGGRHFGNRDSMRADIPTRMSGYRTDVTTPHANAGIPDRAAYLCIVNLGRDTTERLWYRALTTYTTQNSGFADLRRGVTQAANDIYPTNSRVLAVVNQAFDDAEILLTTPATQRAVVKGGPVATPLPETQAVRSVIAFTTRFGRIGYIDVQTRQAFFFSGDFTISRPGGQLSVPSNGKRIYFVNRRGQLAFVEPLTRNTGLFSSLFIRQQNDIGSAAISPDEKTVALTSIYDNDPNIYIATIGTISAMSTTVNPAPRIIPVNRDISTGAANGTGRSEGRDISGVRYPDALAWSPDTRNPAIGLDALNQLKVDRDTISFWSLYYADLAGARPEVYDLFPPQADVTLNYPTFASRSGSSMAFTEILPNNTNDIYIADFDLGADRGFLNLSRFAFMVGTARISVLSADQASFSPDDRQLCFIAPNVSSQAVFIYSFPATAGMAVREIDGIALDSSVVRPVWANIDVQFTNINDNTSPEAFALRALPNPANSESPASVQFTLPHTQAVTLTLVNTLGQQVMTLATGTMQAGSHAISLDAGYLPSGLYVLRLQAGSVVATQKLTLVR